MSATRIRVLHCFRLLHRARQKVFKGDEYALDAARSTINTEFRKNLSETDPEAIEKLIKKAEEANSFLRKDVLQAQEYKENTYKLKITDETHLGNNIPYDPDFEVPRRRRRRKDTSEEKS